MAKFTEYDQFDGLGLAEQVREKNISPKELCEEAISRAEAVNPKLNAIIVPILFSVWALTRSCMAADSRTEKACPKIKENTAPKMTMPSPPS